MWFCVSALIMVHTPEGEKQLQNWNEIVHLSLLFLEAIAFESVIFTTDFSYSAFHHKGFQSVCPFRKVTVWPALPLNREISSTLNINVTFLRTWGLGHRWKMILETHFFDTKQHYLFWKLLRYICGACCLQSQCQNSFLLQQDPNQGLI